MDLSYAWVLKVALAAIPDFDLATIAVCFDELDQWFPQERDLSVRGNTNLES